MADEEKKNEDAEDAEIEGEEGEGEGGKKSGGGIVKIAIFAGVPLVLILGVVVVIFFTSFGRQLVGLGSGEGAQAAAESEEAAAQAPTELIYFPIPELLVNLSPGEKSKKTSFLRLSVKLEVPNEEAVTTLEIVKPRLIDQFQVFLRELRIEDIQGSAGLQRLREGLLKRVNEVAKPVKVKDVLFETMLVQ